MSTTRSLHGARPVANAVRDCRCPPLCIRLCSASWTWQRRYMHKNLVDWGYDSSLYEIQTHLCSSPTSHKLSCPEATCKFEPLVNPSYSAIWLHIYVFFCSVCLVFILKMRINMACRKNTCKLTFLLRSHFFPLFNCIPIPPQEILLGPPLCGLTGNDDLVRCGVPWMRCCDHMGRGMVWLKYIHENISYFDSLNLIFFSGKTKIFAPKFACQETFFGWRLNT